MTFITLHKQTFCRLDRKFSLLTCEECLKTVRAGYEKNPIFSGCTAFYQF